MHNSLLTIAILTSIMFSIPVTISAAAAFDGEFFSGEGDIEYLELLDISRRMFHPDPEFMHIAMLYTPVWNGLVEGPTWNAWWIQNSYGPTYCALPFYTEPFTTFLQNAQDLWFDQMGDGKRAGDRDLVAPDGALCDAALPGRIIYKQGDGRVDIHDWGMEFTAAGLLLQAELLLISRDAEAIAHYLPKLERCARFIETRRDPENNLFLAGPAGNLLAPNYAGWKQPDGSFRKAYLAGLSITYTAALDRLIEVFKLANEAKKAEAFQELRDSAKKALGQLATEEGYFIKSLDPDGTRHGVYGAEKHGYFCASPNHDAIAFRVAGEAQARKIYEKIAAIPELRRHDLIIANQPGLDDMYDPGTSWLWKHGTWVNGGHWSTCEARMILGYYILGEYDDARRSMNRILEFAKQYRMDNPLVEFGSKVYQPKEPINICYDSFGPPAAMVRGLFEYRYSADHLQLVPHIPPAITQLVQKFPIRFGEHRLYIACAGSGPVTRVRVNNAPWATHNDKAVLLPIDRLAKKTVEIKIALGDGDLSQLPRSLRAFPEPLSMPDEKALAQLAQRAGVTAESMENRLRRIRRFIEGLAREGIGRVYELPHARLALQCAESFSRHLEGGAANTFKTVDFSALPETTREAAAHLHRDTALRVLDGLEKMLAAHATSGDPGENALYKEWEKAAEEAEPAGG
jgi:hypothetical protein